MGGNEVDLLPTFRDTPKGFPTVASWLVGGDFRLNVGFASARRLMLMGFFTMAKSKQRLAFMVTTEQEALQGLASSKPGLLIATEQLEQGSGLALVEQAHAVVSDIRTILILDGPQDNLLAAGRSPSDAVLLEADCFGDGHPLLAMNRALALGQRYRSPSLLAALEAAAMQREPSRDGPPDLNRRELEMVGLLVQGLGIGRSRSGWQSATKPCAAVARFFAANSAPAAGPNWWPRRCSWAWPGWGKAEVAGCQA